MKRQLRVGTLNSDIDRNQAIRDIETYLQSGGIISSRMIQPLAVTQATVDPGVVTGVPFGATLPTAATYFSNVFYLTSDGKLYRKTADGSAWQVAVPTVDLTGQITNAQIVDNAITAIKIATAAITTTKIADNQITTPKLVANVITANEIAANAVTTPKIAALAVTTATLDAAAVTTAKLAANSVTSNELAANSVIAGKIAAAIITSTEIAANTILAGNIAAATITGAKIAAATITGSLIAAATITGTLIAANTITAGNIVAATITTAEIAAHTIAAANIAAATITATEIAANTITASKIAAATITATELAANSVTTTQLSAASVTAAKISVTTLSSITADVGTLNAGIIQNAGVTRGILISGSLPGGWTTYLNLTATGTNPILHHPGIDLNADGSANFSGGLTGSIFSGSVFNLNQNTSEIQFSNAGGAGLQKLNWVNGGNSAFIESDGTDIRFHATGLYQAGASNWLIAKVIISAAAPSGSSTEGTLWLKTTATKGIWVYTSGAYTQIV